MRATNGIETDVVAESTGAVVASSYEAAQRTLKMRLSLLVQAKTIDEIEAILGRL